MNERYELRKADVGGALFRTQTLAQGSECRDFYVCRKGSEWEKERKVKGEILR